MNIKNLMIYIWKMDDIDWLGYKLEKKDKFTFHHIIKKCNGGKLEINNGAILTNISHPYLHIIESRDFDMYLYLNNILRAINDQRQMPDKLQLLAIKGVLEQFEREHCSDRTSKGKTLIKEEYLKRRY